MSSIISFVQAHSAAISAVVVAVLDFGIAVNPSWKSNSLIEAVLAFFSPKAG